MKDKTFQAAVYLRLSREDGDVTDGGKTVSNSIANQNELVVDYLKSHPEIKVIDTYTDDGFSGVNFERPEFQRMLSDIRAGKVDCVIVKDLSRFGRNYIESGRYIEKIFPMLGIRFIAITDGYDSINEDMGSDMIIPFKNLINDAYCRDISIKIRSHLDIKRKNGQYIGSFAPYGYKKSPDDKNKLIVDEKAASVVCQIFKWKISGMSGERIAEKLNELGIPTPMEYKHRNGENFQCGFRRKAAPKWQANGVNYILRNEVYTGVLLQGKTASPNYKVRKRTKKDEKDWIRCEDSHEAIVSKEDFQMVHGFFGNDTRIAPEEKILYLFSGFAKCGHCNGNMTRKSVPVKDKRYVYLVCIENKNKMGCTNNKGIPVDKFEKVVLQVINLYIESVFELSQLLELVDEVSYHGYFVEKLQEDIMDKELEIEKKRQYASSIYQDYKEGILSKEEYLELKDCYKTDVGTLQNEIKSLEAEREETARSKKDRAGWIQQFIEYRGFKELSRELLARLVEEIKIYDKDRIEVTFKFKSEYEQAWDYVEKMELNGVLEGGGAFGKEKQEI